MAGLVLRLVALLLGVCLAATPVVLWGASRTESTVVIGYHENEGEIYTEYVRDWSRHIRLNLAGTRCFKSLPPWAHTDEMDGSPDYGRDYLHKTDRIEDLMILVAC